MDEKKDGKEYLLNNFERIEGSYKIPIMMTSAAVGAVAAGLLGAAGGIIGGIIGSVSWKMSFAGLIRTKKNPWKKSVKK